MGKEEKKETLRKLTGYSKKEAKIVFGFLKVNKIDFESVVTLLKIGAIDVKSLLYIALVDKLNKTGDVLVEEAERAVYTIKEKIKLNKELQGLSICTEQDRNVIASAGAKYEEMMNLSENLQKLLIPTNWRPAPIDLEEVLVEENWQTALKKELDSDKRFASAEFISPLIPDFVNQIGVRIISFDSKNGCKGEIRNEILLEKIANKEIDFNGKITKIAFYE